MKKLLMMLVVCFILSGNLPAQSLLLDNTDSLDTYINKYLNELKLRGLSIAIIKNGAIFYQKGYGINLAGEMDSIDEHTLFAG